MTLYLRALEKRPSMGDTAAGRFGGQSDARSGRATIRTISPSSNRATLGMLKTAIIALPASAVIVELPSSLSGWIVRVIDLEQSSVKLHEMMGLTTEWANLNLGRVIYHAAQCRWRE